MMRLVSFLQSLLPPYTPSEVPIRPNVRSQHAPVWKPTAPFLSLPMEMQTEVLLYLELEDILRLRRVCQTLSSATRQRPIWMSILHNPPPPMNTYSFLVDKKLEACTGSDIEEIVIGCLRRYANWGDPSSVRQRKLRITGGYLDAPTIIVPGGRWMIVFNRNGEAVAFDLDDWERPPFVLWSQNLALSAGRIAIDAVLETTVAGFQTEFRIASVLNILKLRAPRKYETIHSVWLVRPTFDATGHVNGLESELLSEFAGEPRFGGFFLSFSGPLLGYPVQRSRSSNFTAIVWDWEKAHTQTDFTKISKWIVRLPHIFKRDGNCVFIRILPNYTLLMGSRHGASLWDLSSIEPVFREEDAQEVQPYCRCDPSVELGMWSSPLTVLRDGTVRVNYYDNKVVRCLSFSGGTIATTILLTVDDESNPVKRFYSGLRHFGTDRFARLEKQAVTVKLALPDQTPRRPSVISCPQLLPAYTPANFVILDCFSGLIFITDPVPGLLHVKTFIDFPIGY